MVLFKTALLNFKKSVISNILTFLEMTAAVIIFAVMVSSVLIRYVYYEPFEDMFSGKGFYFFSVGGLNGLALVNDPEMNDYILPVSDTDISAYISGIEKIAGWHNMWANTVNEAVSGNNCYSYNDELIRRFQPKLKEGRWLNTSDKATTAEVVVSENNCGWQVGDKIKVEYLYGDAMRNFDAEIVGIMEKGAKIFGPNYSIEKDENFNIMYKTYDAEIEACPIALFSSQYLLNDDALKDIPQFFSGGMIQYSDDITNEQLEEEIYKLSYMHINGGHSVSFEEMEKYNEKYLYQQVYRLLPVIIVIIILVIVSSASSTAIATLRRLRDYSIYYITGLQWKHCVLINLIQSAVISVLSLIAAVGAMYLVKFTPLGESVTVIAHPWTALSAVGLILLYVLVSMVMPIIIIGKSTPKEILTR